MSQNGTPASEPGGTAPEPEGPAERRLREPSERAGPLGVRRMRKDDGRGLTVYEHLERETE